MLQVLQSERSLEAEAEQSVNRETVLEQMGGMPKHLLSIGDLSDRDHRRTLIADHLQQKYRKNS